MSAPAVRCRLMARLRRVAMQGRDFAEALARASGSPSPSPESQDRYQDRYTVGWTPQKAFVSRRYIRRPRGSSIGRPRCELRHRRENARTVGQPEHALSACELNLQDRPNAVVISSYLPCIHIRAPAANVALSQRKAPLMPPSISQGLASPEASEESAFVTIEINSRGEFVHLRAPLRRAS